jgi:hypothetical protein
MAPERNRRGQQRTHGRDLVVGDMLQQVEAMAPEPEQNAAAGLPTPEQPRSGVAEPDLRSEEAGLQREQLAQRAGLGEPAGRDDARVGPAGVEHAGDDTGPGGGRLQRDDLGGSEAGRFF